MIETAAPEPDEFEVTLLGRGRGESVVVHLGDKRWMVVDSFAAPREAGTASSSGPQLPNADTGTTDAVAIPAPLEYLRSIGVEPEQVQMIVLTHIHTDHFRSIERLHQSCENARLILGEALTSKGFGRLYSDSHPVGQLVASAKSRRLSNKTGYKTVKCGARLLAEDKCEIWAIAPTDDACNDARDYFDARLLEIERESDERAQSIAKNRAVEDLRDENRCSVGLHVEFRNDGPSVLLAADMIAHERYGWEMLVDENSISTCGPVSLLKVPHHGSSKSDCDELWERWTDGPPVAIVTPYDPLLPKGSDVDRLLRKSSSVWQAGGRGAVIDLTSGAGKATRQMGTVQARWSSALGKWVVRVDGAAFEHSAH